jgi:four helix bundle protein
MGLFEKNVHLQHYLLPVNRIKGKKHMKTHKDLDLWKTSIDLVLETYELTTCYPKEEIYGMVSQMRRAVVSVSSNISEGAARKHPKEFIRFLQISSGSLSELETQLIISKHLKWIKENDYQRVTGIINTVRAQLSGLERFLSQKI